VCYIVDFAPVGLELEAVENRQAGRAEAQQEATGPASAGVVANRQAVRAEAQQEVTGPASAGAAAQHIAVV
jgi:hypothetical protein